MITQLPAKRFVGARGGGGGGGGGAMLKKYFSFFYKIAIYAQNIAIYSFKQRPESDIIH